MGQTALGFMLKRLREERGLSLRELAQLGELDHAYIYRLETGDKEAPSEDTLAKLVRGLKAGKREAEMLRYVAKFPDTDPELLNYVFSNPAEPDLSFELFSSVASINHRGNPRTDYAKLFARVRKIIAEEDQSG